MPSIILGRFMMFILAEDLNLDEAKLSEFLYKKMVQKIWFYNKVVLRSLKTSSLFTFLSPIVA